MKLQKLTKVFFAVLMIISFLTPDICLATEQIIEVQEDNLEKVEQNEDVIKETDETVEIDETDEISENNVESETLSENNNNIIIEQDKVLNINNLEQEVLPIAEIQSLPQEITVKPGVGTLNQAILNAQPGSKLILEKGSYGGSDIIINKSISIIGKGRNITFVTPKIIITDEDETKNDVYLEGFSSDNQQPKDGHIFYDIQKPVNLTFNNVEVFHIGRTLSQTHETTSLNIQKGADGTVVNAKNTTFCSLYDGINVESSNNKLTFDNSKILCTMAIRLANGSNNELNLCNGTTIQGRSSYFFEDEAISIIGQNNLKLTIDNCTIEGNDSKGEEPTYLISFDGESVSNSTNIRITGNTTIDDYFGGTGSSIFNFGANNREDNNNLIYLESSVKVNPNTIESKYNVNSNYAVIGIFDKDGNCTIKVYDKGGLVDGIEELPETQDDDYSWFKKIAGDTLEFDTKETVTQNMDLHPVSKEKVNLYVNDTCYEVIKGISFSDALSKDPSLKEVIDNIRKNDRFIRFVDQNGSDVKDDTIIIEETTIIPKYTVKVKVTYNESSEEFELENGSFLADLSESLAKYEKTTNKTFAKFINVNNKAENITKNTVVNEDIEITPIYNVSVKVGKETFELEEGKTLNDLSSSQKEKLESEVSVDKKVFRNEFENSENEIVDYSTKIFENTELTPKYNVVVTVVKLDKTEKKFTLKEGQTLRSLGADVINQIEEFITESVNFEHFINDNGEIVDYDKPINESTQFIPIYNQTITVTINGTNKTENYILNEGENLNSLDESTQNEIKDLVKKDNKDLAYFIDSEGNKVDFTTSIAKRTTLTPVYKITVTVKPQYDSQVELEMLERSSLSTLEETLRQQFEEKTNKDFKGYYDLDGNLIDVASTFSEHVTIIPKYDIHVKVQKDDGTYEDIKVEEGSTLKGMANKLEQFESGVKNKQFDRYVDEENQDISEEKVLTENIVIIPKYNINVTIKKSDETTVSFDVPEDFVLHRLTEDQMDTLNSFVSAENKVFAEKFADELGNEVDFYTILNENIILTPKYNVVITVVTEDGEQTLTVEEGKTLNDLSSEEKEKFEEIKNKFKGEKEFSDFEIVDTDEKLTLETQIFENLTVKPVYKEISNAEDNKVDEDQNIQNPNTGDNILNYIIIMIVCIIAMAASMIIYKKKNI